MRECDYAGEPELWNFDQLHELSSCGSGELARARARAEAAAHMDVTSGASNAYNKVTMKSVLLVLALGGVALAEAPNPHIAITVGRRGFEPGDITVQAKKPVTLVFTRTTEATCAKSVIVVVDDKTTIEKPLPLDKAVEIPVTFPKAGKLSYGCSMDMVKGTITVQ